MNKIQTTKANSTLRRFFDRVGGGGVKALSYNKTASVDGNGGGGSSEEAQKLFDAMFGQTPYIAIEDSDGELRVVPLVEYLTNPIEGKPQEGLLFKNTSPIPNVDVFPATMILVEVPEDALPDGPWYFTQPITDDYDLDLRSFPLPEEGSPVILTGVDVPDTAPFTVLTAQGETQEYHLMEEAVEQSYYCQLDLNGIFFITKDGNDWVWTYQG